MVLDADTVLWALRGLHDPQDVGVRAHDVARFMSKDATLSDDYTKDDVAVVLESLVADGTLTYGSTTGTEEESAENASSHDTTLYRFPTGPESLVLVDRTVADASAHNGWDHWLGPGADSPRDFLLDTLADDAAVEVAVDRPTAEDEAEDEAETNASLRVRVDELEHERDALLAERDTWRRRAESADEEVARARGERDELRLRIRELESLLARERDVASEQSATARRAAAGLARALEDLARLEPSAPDRHAQARASRHRKAPRGNWLQ